MALNDLSKDGLKLILFGGKGGVGKTTCASSAGFYLASAKGGSPPDRISSRAGASGAKEGFKTLLISTDPAHSLSDSLGQEIGAEIKEVKGIKNLSAIEISAAREWAKFKTQYETQMKKILETSTYLDEEDIASFLSLSIPGIDEVMGFKTIVDLIDEARFDKYIVDTAPTGHALRLLTVPELLDNWIKVLAKMRWKYRYMVESFAGKYKPDEGDDFLLNMKKTVKRIENLLKDQNRCEFVAVTIPEDMAILETERLVKDLVKYGIMVKQLVINNVVKSENCPFCSERRKWQEKYINQIGAKFSNLKTTIVPLQAREVKGIDALNNFKEVLFK